MSPSHVPTVMLGPLSGRTLTNPRRSAVPTPARAERYCRIDSLKGDTERHFGRLPTPEDPDQSDDQYRRRRYPPGERVLRLPKEPERFRHASGMGHFEIGQVLVGLGPIVNAALPHDSKHRLRPDPVVVRWVVQVCQIERRAGLSGQGAATILDEEQQSDV